MTENEETNRNRNEEEDDSEEVEEEEVVEQEEDDDDDPSKPQNKVQKIINKQKKKVEKAKDRTKNYFIRKLEILIFICLVIVVLSWSHIENALVWVTGQEEITIVSKTTDNGCYEIVAMDGNKYCLDLESYEIAEIGGTFLLDEYESYHILRTVR